MSRTADTAAGFSLAPAPMEGKGSYNRNSAVQQAGASPAIATLVRAAEQISLPDAPSPIAIADYGSSQGHSSLAPMAAAIHALRGRVDAARPISVFHTDLPGSDFSALFGLLTTDPQSYLRWDGLTYAAAVGRSFYEQILPAQSINLGWCSWAIQWLSRAPAPIPDQVQVAYSADAATRAVYARQAAEDWQCFLRHRGAELASGGRLIVVTMALTEDGDFGYRPVLDALYAALRDRVGEGFMSEAELHGMAIPTVGRSLPDIEAPFAAGSFAGLTIEDARLFLAPDPIWEDYARNGDARAYGARWAAFSRSSVLPTLALALSDPGPERTLTFLGRVEAGMADRLAAAPRKFPIPLAIVDLRKA